MNLFFLLRKTCSFFPIYQPLTRLVACLLGLAFFLNNPAANAQNTKTDSTRCATPDLTDGQRQQLDELAKLAFELKRASGKVFLDITHVPIRPHIFRTAQGKGGFDLARMNNAIALTNRYYQTNGVGVQFYFAGTSPDYIDNDALSQVFPAFNESGIAGRDAINAMNMYFVNAFSEGGLGGYAYFPANDLSTTRSFILAGPYSTENTLGNFLIPHELGHNFHLYHTFQGSTSSDPELVTRGAGANCTTTGDLVCDTPADPYGRSGSSTTFVNGCLAYNGTATDPQGMTYAPSMSNIMSYYNSCAHDFTAGQYDRMQAGLALRQSHTAYSLTFPPTAVPSPTNVQASIGLSGNIRLTWQDNASNEMGYFVERATTSTGPFVAIGGTAPNVTYFMDTKLPSQGAYFYRVRPSNTTDGALSNVATISVSRLATCSPNLSLGCVQGDGLNTLQLNGENLSLQSGCSPNAYQEFPVSGLTVVAGQTCYLNGQFLNGLQSEGVAVWLDLNRDGIYSSNERLFGTTATGGFSGSLTLPTTLTVGPLAMRVLVTQGYNSNSPCSTDSFGEAEDYTIMVQPNSCAAPGGLATINLGIRSAQLNWSGVGDAFGYELRWKAQDSPTWNTIPNLTTNSYLLSDLTAGTGYQWQVRSVCAADNSVYAGQTFQTICPGPTNLTATAVSGTSAQLNWSDLGPNRTYDLVWRMESTSTWQVVDGLTTPTYALTGLREGTVYVWQVRSVCTPTGSQTFSPSVSFATTGSCRPSYLNGCTAFDGLNSLVFNGVPMSLSSGCSAAGYRQYASPVAPVTAGRPYSFSGTLLSSSYSEGIGIWLDRNRNGIFESSERLYGTPNLVTGSFSGSLTIPATTTPGPVTMRVVVLYGNYPYDACGNYVYGETEDYQLNVYATNVVQLTEIPQPACLETPLSLSFATTTPFGAGNVFSIQLSDPTGVFGATPTLIGSVASSVGSSLTVTFPNTLPPGDGYQMRVVSSNPSTTNNPTTALRLTAVCSCPVAVSLVASQLTGSAVNLSWVSEATVLSYSLRWRVQGATVWNTVSGITTSAYFLRSLTSAVAYEWQVLANCTNGQPSDWSAPASFQTPSCGTATLLSTSQTVVAGQTASLSIVFTGQSPWNFNLNRNGSSWANYSGVSSSPFVYNTTVPSSSTFTLTNASNACGTLPSSGTAFVTAPCSIPTSLTEANQTATSINVRWSYLSGNYYQIAWKETTATTWTESTSYCCSSYTISGLQLGKTYHWRIRSLCPDGNVSDWSAERVFTISCPVPFGQSEQVSPTQASLYWSYMTQSNNSSLTYNLQWRPLNSSSWTTQPAVCCSGYTLTGLTSGQGYEWRIQSICPDGSTSSYSAPRSFTASCSVPTSLYDSYRTSTSTQFYWNRFSNTTYELQWRPAGNAATPFMSATGLTSTPYTLTGLTNATQYEVRLRAVCSTSESSTFTTSYFFTTACFTANLFTPIPGPNQAQLQWDNYGPGVRYNLLWRVAGSPTSTTIASLTSSIYSLTGLTNNTVYEIQVQSVCSDGNVSGLSSVRSFTTGCYAPTSPYISSIEPTFAIVNWESKGPGTRYQVQFRTSGNTTWANSFTVATNTAFLGGLSPGTAYEWRVTMLCPDDTPSAYTTPGSFTTRSCTIPTALTLLGTAGASAASLDWAFVSGNSGYEVQWRVAGTLTWPNTITASSSDHYLTNLNPETAYEWRVRTFCGSQSSSDYSVIGSFTTTACTAPTNPVESGMGTNFVVHSWAQVTGVTGYAVRWREAGTTIWNSFTTCCSGYYNYSVVYGRSYEWQVATRCGPTTSDYSSSRYFTMSCPVPFNLNETTTTGMAQLNWSYQGNVTYTVQWRLQGSANWTSAQATFSPLSTTGLAPNQAYEWRMQTNCSDGSSGAFTTPRSFTTICKLPSFYYIFTTGATSTWFGWNNLPGVEYSIRYRPSGSTTWTTVSSLTASPYNLTGLTNNTSYEWQIQTVCATPDTSDFSASNYFYTQCSGNSGWGQGIGSSTANLNWDTPNDGSVYDLIWRTVGSPTSTTVSSLTSSGSNSSMSYLLTGLIPLTAYEWQLTTRCPAGAVFVSGWRQFTTSVAPACSLMYTLRAGNWTDSAVWSCGRVPVSTDLVEIRHAVTIPANTTGTAQRVRYTGGGKIITELGGTLRLGW